MCECIYCNSKNITVNVDLTINIEGKHISKITKKVLQSKETKLMYANWERATVYCVDCGKSYRGC